VITVVMIIAIFLAACQNKDENSESKRPDVTEIEIFNSYTGPKNLKIN